jgi:hypothetical protein
MLSHLGGRASDRKLRLFVVGCMRRIWPLLTNDAGRRLAETAEAFADGRATLRQLRRADGDLNRHLDEQHPDWFEGVPSSIGLRLLVQCFNLAWDDSDTSNRETSARQVAQACSEAGDTPAVQADLLRCIIGNPFKPFSIAPAVLASQGSTVVRMATAIYHDRHWDDMPLLGDALEDAGCSDSDVLAHCRGKREHARGCHVLDAILGRS